MDNRPQAKILVLGSTPELRDLALKYNCQLITVDLSQEMIAKLTPLMKYNPAGQEKIYYANWLQMPLTGQSIDIILGDGVYANAYYENWSCFSQELKRVLKKDGRIIVREIEIDPSRERKTVEQHDQEFQQQKYHWFDLWFNLYLYSDLTEQCYDAENYKWSLEKFYQQLETAWKQGRLSAAAWQTMAWFKGNLTHSFVDYPLLTNHLQKHFTLIKRVPVADYRYSQDSFRLYFLRSK